MGATSLVKVTGAAAAFTGVWAVAVAADSAAQTAAPTMSRFVITASAVTSAEYRGKNDAPIPARAQDRRSRVPGHFCWIFRVLHGAAGPPAVRPTYRSGERPLRLVANLPRLPSQPVRLVARVLPPDDDARGHAA